AAVRTRDDDPVVLRRVDRLVADRVDPDQRTPHNIVTERFEAGDELVGLTVGTGDDDLHRSRAASSRPSATGSSPVRRSSHEPSSAAISPVSVTPSWYAATGARQPPPTAATAARSASTRRRVSP